jgi:hypothetical protein
LSAAATSPGATTAGTRVVRSIEETIGGTPLVRLRLPGVPPTVELWGKCEWFNPGGSVKDRTALSIVREGERSGALRAGKTIVDTILGTYEQGTLHSESMKSATLSQVQPLQGADPISVGIALSLRPRRRFQGTIDRTAAKRTRPEPARVTNFQVAVETHFLANPQSSRPIAPGTRVIRLAPIPRSLKGRRRWRTMCGKRDGKTPVPRPCRLTTGRSTRLRSARAGWPT